MLTKVDGLNAQGTVLSFPFFDPSSGFLIKGVDGLDPVKATIVSSKFANMDGGRFHSSSRETRNLIVSIDLKPDLVSATVEDLRNQLYSVFMPKTEVTLKFYRSDGLVVHILGYVESLDAPLFVQNPKATISILCFNPDFYDPIPVVFSGSTTSTLTSSTLDYEGTTESGAIITLSANRSLSAFTLYHQPAGNSLVTMDFSMALVSGDVLQISTVPGDKGALLTRASVVSSVLYGVSPFSNWLKLAPGPNEIRFYAEGAAVPFTIEYTNKYGGL